MKEKNIEIIKVARDNAKDYLKNLNKFFVKNLHLEQDRSDPMFTFYWYKEEHLIADMGIDADDGILLVLIEANLFEKRMDLIVNNYVEFLPEYEGEKLMCVEVYTENEIELVKSLAQDVIEAKRCA